MKKFLMMSIILLGAVISFSACGSDNDDVEEWGKVTSSIDERGDNLILRVNLGGFVDVVTTAEFKNEKVSAVTTVTTWPTYESAQDNYNDIKNTYPTTISGKKVTSDVTKDFIDERTGEGFSKDAVRALYAQMIKQYEDFAKTL